MKTKSGVEVTRKLKNCPYGNVGIVVAGNTEFLISYNTTVGEVFTNEKGCRIVRIFGLYSRTTRKHISFWMRELGSSFTIAKMCVEDNMDYNLTTGEFVAA